jgi:putative endopeptidase
MVCKPFTLKVQKQVGRFIIFLLRKLINHMFLHSRQRSKLAVLVYFLIFTFSANAQEGIKNNNFINHAYMDFSQKPGENFYLYANGRWLMENPIPAKETRWGSFNVLREFNSQALKGLLADAAADKKAPAGSIKRRVADFYTAAMDSIAVEKAGVTPILTDLERVKRISSTEDVLNEIAYQRSTGSGNPLFGFFVGQDRKNPQVMVPQLSQGGTSLPDRDYYLKNDQRSQKIQAAYKKYLVTLFTLAGATDELAKQNAEKIFNLEKKLAAAQWSRVEMRDPYRTYNKFSLADLNRITPTINWENYLPKLKVNGRDSILVNAPRFFAVADSVLKNTPASDMQVYLQWNILKNAAPYLSHAFVKANFEYNQVLSGQQVMTPRWQRMSSLTDNTVGELLGQLYVEKYFKPEAKARMQEMIRNLVKAYEIRIKNLDWMSDTTKQKALDKLKAFTPKIAYPDKWKTYDGLNISPESFFANLRNAGTWSFNDMVGQLGKPVDKTRWGMTPPTVNAYYNPVMNEIVFPSGILQFPFFHPEADDAVNYGAIGAVIGHEISHGFDDSGSQYDKDGSLRNWWTKGDLERFKAKAKLLQEQFDAYTVQDTLHVNGKLTLGENIGDLGGLNAAYEAFKMTAQGKSKKKINGFTPDQRFFLSWAQVWRANIRPETEAQFIVTDSHSPGMYRAIGAPVNMDAWYEAFDIKPTDKLYKKPEDRIKIW